MIEDFVFHFGHLIQDFDLDKVREQESKVEYTNVFSEGSYQRMVGESEDIPPSYFDNHPLQRSQVEDGPAWEITEYIANILDWEPHALGSNFIKLKSGQDFKWHVDAMCRASINIILRGFDAHVMFKGYPDPIYYETAILNTSVIHCVPKGPPQDRVMLKLRVPHSIDGGPTLSYNEVVKKFKLAG